VKKGIRPQQNCVWKLQKVWKLHTTFFGDPVEKMQREKRILKEKKKKKSLIGNLLYMELGSYFWFLQEQIKP